jgi:hypothetical protein
MIIHNDSANPYIFRDAKSSQRFFLKGRNMELNAPEWVGWCPYAIKLLEEGKISFDKKNIPKNDIDQLKLIADGLDIKYGDGITESALSILIKKKQDSLK